MFAYAALLFIVLTPGVLLRLPMKGSKMTVALTHGAIFGVVWYFTHQMVLRASYEGFQEMEPRLAKVATPSVPGRVSMNSPELKNAQARFNDANMRLQAIQDKYDNAAQMAVNIENDLIDARKQVKNAERELRVVKGLPPEEPKKGTKTVLKR